MARFRTREGEVVEVSEPSEMLALVQEGAVGVPGDRVRIAMPDGRIGTIDGAEAVQAFLGGARPITERAAEDIQIARTSESDARTVVESAADRMGIALGPVTNALVRETDRGTRRTITEGLTAAATGIPGTLANLAGADESDRVFESGRAERRRVNPVSSGIGTATADVTLALGGARVPFVPGREGSSIAGATARLGERIGGVPGAITRFGLEGAAEGAFMGGADAMQEAQLRNAPLQAEAALTRVLAGGAVGFAAGPLAAGATAAVSRGLRALAPEAFERAAGALAFRHLQPRIRHVKDALRRDGIEALDANGAEAIGLNAIEQNILRGTPGEIADAANARLGELAGRVRNAMRQVDSGATVDTRSIREGVQDILDSLDTPFQQDVLKRIRRGLGRPGEDFGTRLVREAAGPLATGTRPVFGQVPKQQRLVFDVPTEISAAELHELRVGLDRMLFRGDAALAHTPTPTVEAMRGIRNVIEAELEATSTRAGSSVGAEYLAAKKAYERTRVARDIAAHAFASDLAPAGMGASLAFYKRLGPSAIAGLVGAGGGGGPVGGIVMAFLTGAAMKWLQKNGARVGAQALLGASNAARFLRAQQLLTKRMDDAVRAGLREGVRSTVPGDVRISRFAEVVRTNHGTDLVRMHARAREATTDIAGTHPEMATAMSTAMARQQAAIAARMPGAMVPPGTLQPHLMEPGELVSDFEKSQFLRYQEVAVDPMLAIEQFESGTLSPEAADALREVWPAIYADMTARIQDELAQMDKPPPYATSLQLSILFPEIPTHPSLTQQYISRLQEPYLEQAGAEVGGAMNAAATTSPQVPRPAPQLSEGRMSPAQRDLET